MYANLITTLTGAFTTKTARDRRPGRRHAFRPVLDGLEARISLSGTVTTINPPPTPVQTSPAPTP